MPAKIQTFFHLKKKQSEKVDIQLITQDGKAHPDDGQVDEVVLTCSEENKEELSEIYVVFSPNYYAKVGAKHSQQQLTEDLVLPSSLDYQSFNKWLIKYQQKDDAMQIKRIPLQIKRN